MRLGMLTYHNANNFGAALQAYALEKFLSSNGIDCEYIDYRCESVETRYRKKGRNILRNYMNGERNKSFNSFRQLIRLSDKIYTKKNIREANSIYDAFLVGSDQVWNYKMNGCDWTYLLEFANHSRISYASSLGLDAIPDDLKVTYTENLRLFQSRLVREKKAKNVLETLGVGPCTTVLDPCFLLSQNDWNKLTKDDKIGDYILYYAFDSGSLSKFYGQYHNQIDGYKIIKLGGGIKIQDFISPSVSVKYTTGPLDFISLIKNAKLVVTDSFHATVFSIIFNTPFVVFLRNRPGKDERIQELLQLFHLENREFSTLTTQDLFVLESEYMSILLEESDNSRNLLMASIQAL